MKRKRIQLGLLHVAVAMTAVPVDSTLNRIMIKELALSATLVAVLVTLPYLFSPIQLAIGSFADRYPIFGRRRTPYIVIGLILSAVGIAIAPTGAFLFATNTSSAILISILGFGLWGMGFNFATVSYFSLASELSGPKESSQTISTMYFMMITSVIITGITLSRFIEPYSPEAVTTAIWVVSGVALGLGLLGVIGLEPVSMESKTADVQLPLGVMVKSLSNNRQARLFFGYLILLLAAVLGQDVLLEPFAGETFGMTVSETTRLTSIYGVCFLITLATAGLLEKRTSKRFVAIIGSWGAIASFAVLVLGGLLVNLPIFYLGVVLLGLAIGFSTVSNHSLMLDMTTAQNVGLFIGAWGMATAFARLVGSLVSSIVRDVAAQFVTNPALPYIIAFGLNIGFLLFSLYLLRQVNVQRFQVEAERPSLLEQPM
ncbi:MAG: BCD family MFS transporter [Chloroflexi bacterium]|nr:BCD family MFS transporter [Chloroflexota bacterium]